MARPHKQTVDYFPHDANAYAGDTLTVLQSRFGNDGYAFWFKLLEKLASTDGHYLDCRNSTKWQLLLARTGVNEITGVEIMNLLVEMQAIDKELWESKLIWCQKLVDNIADVYKNRRREIPQKPVITDNNPITTEDNALTTDESTQSKVKETKVNNIRGKKTLSSEDKKAKEIWEKCLEILKEDVNQANFDIWLKGTVGLLYKETVFIIGVPSEDIARHLMENMRSRLENVLGQVTKKRLGLGYRIIKKELPDA